MKKLFTTMLLVLCLISLSVGPVCAQDSGYTLIDMGTLGPEALESYPINLNDLGQVVGESYGGAFLWDSKTGMQDFNQLVGRSGQAIYINNQGQVVGGGGAAFFWSPSDGFIQLTNTYSYPGGINNLGQVVGQFDVWVNGGVKQTHAFLWSKDKGLQDLGTLAGNRESSYAFAVGINDHGQVVGSSSTASWYTHAFRWTEETGMQDLGFDVEYRTGELFINNNGEIAGSRYVDNTHLRGFLWTPQKGLIDLGTLSSLPEGESIVGGMNDHGQVIGKSDTISGYRHAFVWTPGKGMQDLGTLGGNYSSALDINNLGQIVGVSNLPSGERHAFLWTEKDGMIDLGTLEGGDSEAYGINNSGQIIGISDKFYGWGTGFPHAVFWQPLAIDIKIDIKPGSNTNPINLGAKGVIPVAVLTTAEFKASDLDPATVLFAGASPLRWSKQDVDYDGDMDLLFHFDVKKLQLTQSSVEASLTGKTYAGMFVKGTDKVKIVPVVSYP